MAEVAQIIFSSKENHDVVVNNLWYKIHILYNVICTSSVHISYITFMYCFDTKPTKNNSENS